MKPVRILLLLPFIPAFAWHTPQLPWSTIRRQAQSSSVRTATTTATAATREDHFPTTTDRRSFLAQAAAVTTPVVVTASSLFVLTTQTSWAAAAALALSSDAALKQWQSAVKTIDALVENWDSIASKGGGDAIRTQLGTQGVASPLFQIDKAIKVLREDADDLVEFTEQAEEFSLTLSRADSMAYSANFAGGSGKPTPPAVYIEKSKKEVLALQRIAETLSSQINI